jgi:hypothetical protein
MLYPESQKIQDNGYDLVRIDDDITLVPHQRGRLLSETRIKDLRNCHSLCGCALYIKKSVIQAIPQFPIDGMNRWGEFLYMHEAQKRGFKIAVMGHCLYHDGKSTKINSDKMLSSESYLLEREIWQGLVDQYIDPNQINKIIKRELSAELTKVLSSCTRILFYGAGTVSEFIYNKMRKRLDSRVVDFCSGLEEEEGQSFCHKKIQFYKKVNFENYDIIIITVFQKEQEIGELLIDRVPSHKLYYIAQNSRDGRIEFDIKQL